MMYKLILCFNFLPSQEMCTIEEPNEEFTSRHSLEWKFLFLDHRYNLYFNVFYCLIEICSIAVCVQ